MLVLELVKPFYLHIAIWLLSLTCAEALLISTDPNHGHDFPHQ